MVVLLRSATEREVSVEQGKIVVRCPTGGLTLVGVQEAIERNSFCSGCGRQILAHVVSTKLESGKRLLRVEWTCISFQKGCPFYDKWVSDAPPKFKDVDLSGEFC